MPLTAFILMQSPWVGINFTLPSLLGQDLKLEVLCLQTHYTAQIPSHSLKKSRLLWSVMIDDNAPTHERRKLVKTYKNVLPLKRIVVAEVCKETKNEKKNCTCMLSHHHTHNCGGKKITTEIMMLTKVDTSLICMIVLDAFPVYNNLLTCPKSHYILTYLIRYCTVLNSNQLVSCSSNIQDI